EVGNLVQVPESLDGSRYPPLGIHRFASTWAREKARMRIAYLSGFDSRASEPSFLADTPDIELIPAVSTRGRKTPAASRIPGWSPMAWLWWQSAGSGRGSVGPPRTITIRSGDVVMASARKLSRGARGIYPEQGYASSPAPWLIPSSLASASASP